jgi:hypothetical protein
MSRSTKIIDKAMLVVGQNNPVASDVLLYKVATDVSRRIAEETLSIETSDTLSITASETDYDEPSGFYRLKALHTPGSTLFGTQEVDRSELDTIEQNTPNLGGGTICFARWGGQMRFYPQPSAGTYTLYYYGLPTSTMSSSSEPETPSYQDDLIFYGLMCEILPLVGKFDMVQYYESKYGQEFQRCLNSHRRTKTTSLEIYPHEV